MECHQRGYVGWREDIDIEYLYFLYDDSLLNDFMLEILCVFIIWDGSQDFIYLLLD